MQSRKALILLFRLFRYRFSIRLCELFWRLPIGEADLPREVSEGGFFFPVRSETADFDFLDSTSRSTSHCESDSELLGDEARLGAEGVGLLYGAAAGVAVLFSKAVGMSHGSMNDF